MTDLSAARQSCDSVYPLYQPALMSCDVLLIRRAGQKKEEIKLLEGVRIQAIDRRSAPLQQKLQEAKTNDEIRALRRQIRELRYTCRE